MPIPSSPIARYRASELVGFSDTDPVATWPDEIGSHDLASVNSALTTYSAAGFNGMPAVDFTTGSDSRMLGTDSPSLGVAQPHTYCVIFQFESLTFSASNLGVIVDSLARSALFAQDATPQWRMFAGSSVVDSGTNADLDEHLLFGIFDGASSSLWLGDTQIAAGNPGTGGVDRVMVNADGGNPTGAAGHADMLVAEILIYDRALNAAERSDLFDYYQNTYFPSAGETVTFAGTLPALTGSATIDASADVQLTGTLPALTGSVGVDVSADVQSAGTLPALTGTFDIDSSSDIALTGELPALRGSATIVRPDAIALAGTLPALTGSFTIATLAAPPERTRFVLAESRTQAIVAESRTRPIPAASRRLTVV